MSPRAIVALTLSVILSGCTTNEAPSAHETNGTGGSTASVSNAPSANGGTNDGGRSNEASGGTSNDGGRSNEASGGTSNRNGTSSVGGSSNVPSNNGDTGGLPTGLGSTCNSACNSATPSYPTVTDDRALGNITMYSTAASSGGACLYGDTKVLFFAAMSVNVEPGDGKSQWQEGRLCGQCARVTVLTTQGPKQVVVRIMDKCPDGYCGLDLGGTAPSTVMLDGFGRYDGAWELISCAGHEEVFDGPTTLFVKDGSGPYWSAVQVRNPLMSVTAMNWQNRSDVSRKGAFDYASPQIENYFLIPVEVLQANATFDITITYRDGSTATIALTSAQLAIAESAYEF